MTIAHVVQLFFQDAIQKRFFFQKKFKKEKLNKSKRLKAFKEHDNNKNIVEVNLLKLYYFKIILFYTIVK